MSNQDIIRRKQFCQIVSEIRKSNEYLIAGIDVAKDKHHAFMGKKWGQVYIDPWKLKCYMLQHVTST
jgi:hypothetical protein